MYQHILELMKTFPFSPKIIVTQYEEIERCASEYGFEAITNREPELGISHSIHLGLKAALEKKPLLDGVMFGVCDQPYLKRTTIEKLLQACSDSDKNIVALAWQEAIGNPCVFGKKYYEELLALTLDVGGKKILHRHPEDVELVTAQEAKELIDIDTKDNE
ncbi:MAG: molybdopterin-guanine dinucleotide biosynthesis protein [Herbinix sp.]|jgi:CTP:molybdopterin cytidylyltransferase MocA|nr:molybdopterin-guanine dinucleotide biosynthesis protein [Herbinix sp.]